MLCINPLPVVALRVGDADKSSGGRDPDVAEQHVSCGVVRAICQRLRLRGTQCAANIRLHEGIRWRGGEIARKEIRA